MDCFFQHDSATFRTSHSTRLRYIQLCLDMDKGHYQHCLYVNDKGYFQMHHPPVFAEI